MTLKGDTVHVVEQARHFLLFQSIELQQSIQVERLAEEFGMSQSSFYQHFKDFTGMSPLHSRSNCGSSRRAG